MRNCSHTRYGLIECGNHNLWGAKKKVVTDTQSTKPRAKARASSKPARKIEAAETPIFFVGDTTRAAAGFPADINVLPRASAIETVNFIIATPAPRARTKRPVSKSKKNADLKKTTAKRTRARTSARQPVQRPKQTVAARAPAVPVSAPRDPVVQTALTRQFDRVTPLPRAAAVTLHRKQSLLDMISYWMRQRTASLSRLLARPAPKKAPTKAQRLAAENAALRAELAELRARLHA